MGLELVNAGLTAQQRPTHATWGLRDLSEQSVRFGNRGVDFFFGVGWETPPGHSERMAALRDTWRECLYALAAYMAL